MNSTFKNIFFIPAIVFLSSGCKDNIQSNPSPLPADTTKQDLKTAVTCWLTSPAGNILFQPLRERLNFSHTANQNKTIEVDSTKTYQTIDGFGNTLTGGSALLIHKMDADSRANLLKELFGTDGSNIGLSYLRISVGASDLDEKVFSYNDLPAGETDIQLAKFDLGYDKLHLIPVLKEILTIDPNIKIMASPWSAPPG